MTAKKISRKKLLKEPDEFISTTGRVIQFLREHRRQVTRYGIMAGVILAVGLGVYFYFSWQSGKAQAIQQQALQIYQEASSQSGTPEKAKESYQKALGKFRESLSVSSRGIVGQLSQIYMGHCYFALKEYDQAVAAYSRYLDGPFRAMALYGLGYSYEAKGEYAKGLENYQKNAEEARNPFQLDSMLGMARCYESMNEKPKALEVYQKALAQYPKSQMADFIQWKVNEMKG